MDVILLTMIDVMPIGLVRSTESILKIRQRRRDNGEEIKTCL
jgi:hypothetical protein